MAHASVSADASHSMFIALTDAAVTAVVQYSGHSSGKVCCHL